MTRSSQRTISRAIHRLRLFSDRDALHAGFVALLACAGSVGLVYVAYCVHVLTIARRAGCGRGRGGCLLLFGKHAPHGRVDADFDARLGRAAQLLGDWTPLHVVLLGGGAGGMATEAELARDGLLARGIARDAPLLLEACSRDTLQNLRNARGLLDGLGYAGPVTLLSNRYHLARCALFARQLGFEWDLCAAESRWTWHPRMLWRIAGEAAYVCWLDVGLRWARLTGNARMLARLA